MDIADRAAKEMGETLEKYTSVDNAKAIEENYEGIHNVIHQLDTLHSAIIQKHEADFVSSYKDHMVRVQLEMAEFKKKTSEYHMNMKKSEKIKMLETSISFFREECVKMVAMIDKLKNENAQYAG